MKIITARFHFIPEGRTVEAVGAFKYANDEGSVVWKGDAVLIDRLMPRDAGYEEDGGSPPDMAIGEMFVELMKWFAEGAGVRVEIQESGKWTIAEI